MKVRGNAAYQPKLKEEHVVREIIQRLGYCKIKVRRVKERIPEGGGKEGPKRFRGGPSESGIPDLIGYVPSKVMVEHNVAADFMEEEAPGVFIEVKRPGGDRRPAQEAFIAEAAADGCIAFFAESWEDVVKGFAAHGIDLSRSGGIG